MRFFAKIMLLSALVGLVAACGTIATPPPAETIDESVEEGVAVAQAAETEEAAETVVTEEVTVATEAVTEAAETVEAMPTQTPTEAPTDEPTALPPTETTAPTDEPTAVPPTETIAPTATPTAAPTEAVPTEEAEVAADGDEAEEAVEDAEQADETTDVIASAIARGNVENGRTIFNQQYDTSVGPWICASCHSVDENQQRLVGPPMWGIYERAAQRAEDAGVADEVVYMHQSINAPQAYIVPADAGGAYPENLMPPNYEELFTEQELDDLTAYLLTLGNPNYEG